MERVDEFIVEPPVEAILEAAERVDEFVVEPPVEAVREAAGFKDEAGINTNVELCGMDSRIKIRDALIKAFGRTQVEKDQELLNLNGLGNKKPSELLQQLMVKDTSEHPFPTRSKRLNLCLSAETQEEPHSKRLTTALLKSSNDRTNTSHSGLETN